MARTVLSDDDTGVNEYRFWYEGGSRFAFVDAARGCGEGCLLRKRVGSEGSTVSSSSLSDDGGVTGGEEEHVDIVRKLSECI